MRFLVLPMSRREFIKIGAAAAIGVGVASAIEIPILTTHTTLKLISYKPKTSANRFSNAKPNRTLRG